MMAIKEFLLQWFMSFLIKKDTKNKNISNKELAK